MDDKFIISIYGSHNGALAFYYKGNIQVYEVERFLSYKNAGLAQYKIVWPPEIYLDLMIDDFKRRNNITHKPDIVIWNRTDYNHNGVVYRIHENIDTHQYIYGSWHHIAHTCGTFYQSPFNEALAVSFDGGGEDGFFNIYKIKRGELPTQIGSSNLDLGFAYMIIAHYLKDIKFEHCLSDGNLVYSGKLMGLTGYGEVVEEWLPAFREFYKSIPNGINFQDKINVLGEAIKITFDTNNRIEGKLAYNIAATHQQAFEDVFFELFDSYATSTELPICITGGCALNVLLNTKVREKYNRPVFVSSNSNDCGQAIGMLLAYLKPEKQIDLSRSGVPILDYGALAHYYYPISSTNTLERATQARIVQLLMAGKIIGVVRGNSEHGPRALGHRSIICNPGFSNMKDILNMKVKNREWYRPFAPIAPNDTASTYFDVKEYSPYMSFAFKVKEEWQDKLSSVTHIDKTARVQTLKREDDEWLYDLIKEFGKQSGYEVILNTSFNVAGKPILTTVKDAFEVYTKTQLDCLIIEDYLICKK